MTFDKTAYNREYSRRDRQEAKAAGYCVVCRTRKAVPGETQCEECKGKKREYQREIRKTAEYKERYNAWKRERYKKWREAGLCVVCGRPVYKKGKCRHHYILAARKRAKRKNETAEKRQAATYEHGDICQKCTEPAIPGKKLCKRHYDIVMTYSIPKAIAATQRLRQSQAKAGNLLQWGGKAIEAWNRRANGE